MFHEEAMMVKIQQNPAESEPALSAKIERIMIPYGFETFGDGSKPWYLVNPKIAGKWMFIPLKMVLIGIDP